MPPTYTIMDNIVEYRNNLAKQIAGITELLVSLNSRPLGPTVLRRIYMLKYHRDKLKKKLDTSLNQASHVQLDNNRNKISVDELRRARHRR